MSKEMAYHREYRPSSIDGYVGNEGVKQSLRRILETRRLPQVVLAQGPSGTGKTTLARIMLKQYMCTSPQPSGEACNECYNCQEMDTFIRTGINDALPNIREVDVTESNKKDDIEQLLEEAMMPSFDGNWKGYILDECHMMSPTAQNRLLKTLEEPQERVVIILCTTDPEKLLRTIISRCQYIFKIEKPTQKELVEMLIGVCKDKKVMWDRRALGVISRTGNFTPRDSLNQLESVINEKGDVSYENALEVLNVVADKYYFDFYEILTKEHIDVQRYITYLHDIKQQMSLENFVINLIEFTKRGIFVVNGVSVEALDISEIERYERIFRRYGVGELLNILESLDSLRYSGDREAGLMMLGFRGFRESRLEGLEAEVEKLVKKELADSTHYTAQEEKRYGEEAYQESIKITEEEMEQKIQDVTEELDYTDIAAQFGGEIILD